MQDAFVQFAEMLTERIALKIYTTEDSVRYTFFAALLNTGTCKHTDVVLEYRHPTIKDAEIDCLILQHDSRPAIAIEFKYDRVMPSEKNQPRTRRAGAALNDIFRLARIPGNVASTKYFVYVTDGEMRSYLSKPTNGFAELFGLRSGEHIGINTAWTRSFAETCLNQCREFQIDCSAVGVLKILKYHLLPSFGHLLLTELKRKHLYDWSDAHAAMPAKTARNTLSPLRIALNVAVQREIIDVSPFVGFKLVKRRTRSKRKDVDPFSAEERAAILNALDGQVRNMVQFAFWTGLRTSELIALDWTDIDWQHAVVVISRVLTQGMKEPEDGTKTDAGRREVKLLRPALEALTAQKAHTFLKGVEIFQRPRTAERWPGDLSIAKHWKYALKRAGVRYRNPYQTRHTFATMMLMAGEHVMWVAKQMGPTDWSLTAKRYSRWIPSDMPDAGSKAEAAWSQLGHNSAVTVDSSMPKAGLEPACLAAPPPQDGVSANSTTSAHRAGLGGPPRRGTITADSTAAADWATLGPVESREPEPAPRGPTAAVAAASPR